MTISGVGGSSTELATLQKPSSKGSGESGGSGSSGGSQTPSPGQGVDVTA